VTTLKYVFSSLLCLSPARYRPNFIGNSATGFNPLQRNSIEYAIASIQTLSVPIKKGSNFDTSPAGTPIASFLGVVSPELPMEKLGTHGLR